MFRVRGFDEDIDQAGLRRRGIFRFGDYGWLGEYRANYIKKLLEKLVGREPDIDLIVPLEVFHAAYLLLPELVDRPDPLLHEIVRPVLENNSIRSMTVLDDMFSRIFAAKYLEKLLENLERMSKEESERSEGARKALDMMGSGTCGLSQEIGGAAARDAAEAAKAVGAVAEKAAEDARRYVENAKAYHGLAAGTGHVLTMGELIDIDFVVDVRKLLDMFRDIAPLFEDVFERSRYGEVYDYSLGRDLTRTPPSALAAPDEIFLYRFATATLPQISMRARSIASVVIAIDKSGSMARDNKTEWSRAVALALARLARRNSIKGRVFFFDSDTYSPMDLRSLDAMKSILSIRNEGGTNIDRALRKADEEAGKIGAKIVLITDGIDSVTYKPSSELITVMVQGDNETLRSISRKYLVVEPTREGALKLAEAIKP